MKLIFCPTCFDVVKLIPKITRSCQCGKCKGKYINNEDAVYTDGIPLGFNNKTLGMACANQPVSGWGRTFEAFVIPKHADRMTLTDNIPDDETM